MLPLQNPKEMLKKMEEIFDLLPKKAAPAMGGIAMGVQFFTVPGAAISLMALKTSRF